MVPIQLRAKSLRNKPPPGQGNSRDGWRVRSQPLFPAIEVHGPWVRASRHELGECEVSAFRGGSSGGEGFWTIAGQTKNERTEHMHVMASKSLQALNQILPR